MINLFKLGIILTVLNSLGCQHSYNLPVSLVSSLNLAKQELSLVLADQTKYKLSDIYENHQGLVMIFWQSKCPCVKRYQARVNSLFENYGSRGLAFLHVYSNSDESFSDVYTEYQKRNITLPLVHDEGGQVAKALGVKGTPTAVLLDNLGQVKFMGWLDNERVENESGRIAYLQNALDQYLAKEEVSINTSPMFGCPIL